MKRYLLPFLIVGLCFLSLNLSAEDSALGEKSGQSVQGFSSWDPIYFALGWGSNDYSDDIVKVSLGFKYEFFHQYHLGLYLAYSQNMFWDFWGDSGPFKEIDYCPELFYRFQSGHNIANDISLPIFEYFQLGYEHKSNGEDGADSRGYDRLYATLQLGVGKGIYIGANAKFFMYTADLFNVETGFLSLIDNPDIIDYTSNYEFQFVLGLEGIPIFFLPKKIVLSAGPGGGPFAFDILRGWQQLEVFFLPMFGGLRPYAQLWSGYGQSILDYNRYSFSAHAGLAIEF